VVRAPLVIVVDVLPAKGAQGAATEEAIVGVDIVHVIHETEWSVGLDEIGAVHPGYGLSGKAPDVIHAGLITTVEVLKEHVCGWRLFQRDKGTIHEPGKRTR
jgi:hypothetical protein